MTRYVVKFFKELLGDNGQEAEICQGACGGRRDELS